MGGVPQGKRQPLTTRVWVVKSIKIEFGKLFQSEGESGRRRRRRRETEAIGDH